MEQHTTASCAQKGPHGPPMPQPEAIGPPPGAAEETSVRKVLPYLCLLVFICGRRIRLSAPPVALARAICQERKGPREKILNFLVSFSASDSLYLCEQKFLFAKSGTGVASILRFTLSGRTGLTRLPSKKRCRRFPPLPFGRGEGQGEGSLLSLRCRRP